MRVTLSEYGKPYDLAVIANAVHEPVSRVALQFEKASLRLQHVAKTASPPLILNETGVRAIDIAGVLRVSDSIELEIAPKFLDSSAESWREDFFLAALISRYGHILPREALRSSRTTRAELSSLIAGALVSMYEKVQRLPLRTYSRRFVDEFSGDGELEPEDAVLPTENGYLQEIVEFTSRNSYNGVIHCAANSLPHVSDAGVAARLRRMQVRLGKQLPINARGLKRPRVPSRFRVWQPLYQLSRQIVRNSGVSLLPGAFAAPGFVVNTWRMWEDLLTVGLRIGVKDAAVAPQMLSRLGSRRAESSGKDQDLLVVPDFTFADKATGTVLLLADAKYKTRVDSELRMSEADVYEALAFATATGCNEVILLYPRGAITDKTHEQPGEVAIAERVKIGKVQIIAATVVVSGLSSRGGLARFARNVGYAINVTLAIRRSEVSGF